MTASDTDAVAAATAEAAEFVRRPEFNCSFELPASSADGRDKPLQFTYADFGYKDEAHPDRENVMLFMAPMMASRMLHVAKDAVARRHKVRIISMDRPGFGGSAEVDIKQRLDVTRAATVALLKHLGIRHVALVCQSGGTVFAMDLLRHHPEILHPERPYFALGAPWVHPNHTTSFNMNVTNMLPVQAMAQFDKMISFFQSRIAPVTGASMGVSQALWDMVIPKSALPDNMSVDAKIEDAVFPKVIDYIHGQNIHGISDEAIFLMNKVEGADGWGDWGDYDVLAPRLAESLRSAGMKLEMDIFFSEKDNMIGDAGTKGPVWFAQCWQREEGDWPITCKTEVVKGADHNTVWALTWDVAKRVLEKVGEPASEADTESGV